jgi:hypothetical protein
MAVIHVIGFLYVSLGSTQTKHSPQVLKATEVTSNNMRNFPLLKRQEDERSGII